MMRQYNVPDFSAIKAVAVKHHVPLIVDNTFGACGAICQPIKVGRDTQNKYLISHEGPRSHSSHSPYHDASGTWLQAPRSLVEASPPVPRRLNVTCSSDWMRH
jgi:hypothetical protein